MGKTRRFDPESVDIRPSKKTAGKHGTFTRKKEQPEVITEEWAFKSMKRHIDFLMGKLVTADLVERGEEDFYIDLFKADIGKAVREYDPEKKNEEGRTASALHYLSAVVDNRYRFILRYLGQLCRKGVRVPISTLPPEEAVKYGYVAEESLSDECRNVNEMIFKMDLRTLVGLMTEIEATAFKMLMEGETQCCV